MKKACFQNVTWEVNPLLHMSYASLNKYSLKAYTVYLMHNYYLIVTNTTQIINNSFICSNVMVFYD